MKIDYDKARFLCVNIQSESRYIKGLWQGADAWGCGVFPEQNTPEHNNLVQWFQDMANALNKTKNEN